MKRANLSLFACVLLSGYACDLYSQTVAARIDDVASLVCRPLYPPLSKRLGEQGAVQMQVMVEATGTVSKIKVIKSSGFERLDKSALEATACMKFQAGTIDGVPTAMWVDHPVIFTLSSE
jgi:TonB family protein